MHRRHVLARLPSRLRSRPCSPLLAAPACAQVSDTLKRIAETGTISLGHRESSVPFSYYDNKKQVIGYSHDLMLKVLDSIKAELKLPALTIRLVPVTAQNRIPLVQNGSVDLECGSTSHNAERERQVGFSVSIFVIGTRLMTKRDSGIRDFPDLAGHKVVVTSGTTSERLLRLFNERIGDKVTIIMARDHGESFQALEAGHADAFMLDDALLYGERAKAQQPGRMGRRRHADVVGSLRLHDAARRPRLQEGRRSRAQPADDLGRSAQDLRQVVPAADPAARPEPQLAALQCAARALSRAQRHAAQLNGYPRFPDSIRRRKR